MQKIRIINRFGLPEYVNWDYNPENNPDAKHKAKKALEKMGIENAQVYEVAPLCFWYSTPEKKINCGLYS